MKKSLYSKADKFGEQKINSGFDYKSNSILLESTVSPYLLRNDILHEFINYLNEMVVNNIESVKRIRIHNNFTVDKDTTYIN